MARFFPDAERVSLARELFHKGHYGDLPEAMRSSELAWPHCDDLPDLISEFRDLTGELGLADDDASFMVLVPVQVNGTTLTTPVLIDLDRTELAFTSHPALGAGTIPESVISENGSLALSVREELLGILATWHNAPLGELA